MKTFTVKQTTLAVQLASTLARNEAAFNASGAPSDAQRVVGAWNDIIRFQDEIDFSLFSTAPRTCPPRAVVGAMRYLESVDLLVELA